MGAWSLPLVATKWLDSASVVTVVHCAFISIYLESWHVV